MKKINLLTIAAVATAFVTTSAFACENPGCPTNAKPTPVSVVHPTDLPRQYENATVRVSMVIDRNGVPHDVKAVGPMDRALAERLLPVVSQWRFSPQLKDGKPVDASVVLPLQLIEG